MQFDLSKHKLVLTYPCQWDYKIIGTSQPRLRSLISQVLGDIGHEVSVSSTSSRGKYCTLRVELTVTDEQHRTAIYQAFKAHPDVIMVL